jgi:hypothetical protein
MRRLLLVPLFLLGFATAVALAATSVASSRASATTASTAGVIHKLNARSITVHGKNSLTCRIGPGSPAVGSFHVGSHVLIGCVNGVLFTITRTGSTARNAVNVGTSTSGVAGTIANLTDGSITVHSAESSLTCAIGATSPHTAGFKVGDPVRIGCLNGALYYIVLEHPSTTTTTSSWTTLVSITGTIATLADGSITVHSNDSSLTCPIGSSSPSTAEFKTGQSVRMYCVAGGALYYLVSTTPPPTTTTTTTTSATAIVGISGTITSLGDGSITVHSGDGSLTCPIGTSSPSTAAFKVGDSVRMYCYSGGALYALSANTTTTTTTTTSSTTSTSATVYTAITGTITALSDGSITVTSTETHLTCPIIPASPSTAAFKVGASVRMYCANGSLYVLNASTATTSSTTSTTSTTTPSYVGITGTITALSDGSITVTSTDNHLTCPIVATSPSTAAFKVGQSVRMYCVVGGALYSVAANATTTTTTTTSTTSSTTTTTPAYTTITGTITTLTPTSITVTSTDNHLTCPIGNTSPSTASFAVGNSVHMYCVSGGALYAISKVT